MNNILYTKENGKYLNKNPSWHVEDSPWKANHIISMMVRHSLNPKLIAEIGCGAGEILNRLYLSLPSDVCFVGYDVSHDAINMAKQREKDRLKFKHGDLLKYNECYDLLLAIDVFEHVDDYIGFLMECRKKAKNIIFHIPLDITVSGILRDTIMAKRKSVGHLHYFMKETALAALTDCGYEIVDWVYTAGSLDLAKSLNAKIAFLPRVLLYAINNDLAVKTLGGWSLLVLAK